ncbi:unnamed protein product [Penicillium salamii]|nr:unnamed protein product [Penicillium salamii]CAG8295798.1 unnamed protein product [Penicillium salamii]CAG8400865.1 unnamed protein product [Penicillium salamii]
MDGEVPLPPPRRIRHRSPAPARSATNAASSLDRTRRLSRFDDCSSQPSSDPALFSSDDIPASGLENYHATTPGSGRKRRYRGTWWGEQVLDPKRKRGEFKEKRNVDSGVWMGSDESSVESMMSSDPAWGEDLRKSVLDPKNASTPSTPIAPRASATDTEQTPTQVRVLFRGMAESQQHQAARKVVNECLEKGHETIDLGNFQMETIPPGLLKPLQHLTKLPSVSETPVSEDVFTSLTPFLRLYLPNNSLETLPKDLFELEKLMVLSLRNNRLTEIPSSIGRLNNLRSLNLAVNQLEFLPWELLTLMRDGHLVHLTVHPNKFPKMDSKKVQWLKRFRDESASPSPLIPPEVVGAYPLHMANGPVTYFNPNGLVINPNSSLYNEMQAKAPSKNVPSLRELALRQATKLEYFDQATDEDFSEFPWTLLPAIKKAREVCIAGGQSCSVCGREYVMPCTEWTEWWDVSHFEMGQDWNWTNESSEIRSRAYMLRPLPFRRQGCSLSCVPRLVIPTTNNTHHITTMASQTTFTKPNRPLTWLITGCSSGLGLSIARIAQSKQHTVIATSRQPTRTPELVTEITQNGGEWHTLDVNDPTAASELLSKLEHAGHEIDILVNNAGYAILGAVEQFSDSELRAQMETVYFGPSRLIHEFVPGMRERRFGVVVNISSGAGLEGRESMGAYAAAKAAMDGLSKVLAKEVAPFNVRLLTVWLGVFDTAFGTACLTAEKPLPGDYEGSVVAQMLEAITEGKLVADGDKEKAAKVIYEVVQGEGVGNGHGSERFLPLGRDMIPRVKLVRDQLDHSLDVFGDVAGNVYLTR